MKWRVASARASAIPSDELVRCPRERCSEVLKVELEDRKPLPGVGAVSLRRATSDIREPPRVARTHVVESSGRRELLCCELADRLEHEVPRLVALDGRPAREALRHDRQDLAEIRFADVLDR